MAFQLVYHAYVKTIDIPKLDSRIRSRVKKAIESRLLIAPQQYGVPLKRTLKGYWKLRVGDYRVVFKLLGSEILILGIIHRKEVYETIKGRL
ncbi:MAG: type II toxin-antitoxin system RelE/ParE family toxin [Candidatus Tectomicrobia bacterium]|uniref:Type II toxin-antitoxin system RelE/ParE family toxin n=1 Tax=Tectimicrobiota bacterium TaxID=2528274 RepID=A0A933LPS1_UNCTE|nr:type II toxin-antitoxin system RelE/ParE family toxin [Candidatus Tectomicrobia bacterium]